MGKEKTTVRFQVHQAKQQPKRGEVTVEGNFNDTDFHKKITDEILKQHPQHHIDGYGKKPGT